MRKAASPKPNPDEAQKLAALVDEIGDLETELAPHKAKSKRLELLRKQLREQYDAKPAATKYTAEGTRFVIEIGARGFETLINVSKLFKAVKINDFLAMVSVTLKALQERAPLVAAAVTSETQTGHRSLTVTAKGKPA